MNTKVMFSSMTDEWETPQDLFDRLDQEFCFDLDPCANETNHKCEKYFTKKEDGLTKNWGGTAYFATRHMAERLENGWRNAIQVPNMDLFASCCFLPEQIQNGFMISYIINRMLK